MQCDRPELAELVTKFERPLTEFAVDRKARRNVELMPLQGMVRSAFGQRKNANKTGQWDEPRSEISTAPNYQILSSFRGFVMMKFRFAAAIAALAAVSMSSMASADDKLKYEDLIHCAATNMVIAGVLSLDDGKTKNKDQIETINSQAAALMAIASIGANKDTATVQADTSKETNVVIAVLADKEKSKPFIATEVPKCNTLGQAAVQVVNESKTGK